MESSCRTAPAEMGKDEPLWRTPVMTAAEEQSCCLHFDSSCGDLKADMGWGRKDGLATALMDFSASCLGTTMRVERRGSTEGQKAGERQGDSPFIHSAHLVHL